MASKLWQHELRVAVNAARAGGAIIKHGFTADKHVEYKKNASDLVTQIDLKSEELVMQHLKEAFPTHHFIGEEGSSNAAPGQIVLTDEPTWMCDPLDGTTNMVHSFPFVCISIALVVKKEVVVGVVFNPILDEMFTASRGGGAMLNDKAIHVSKCAEMAQALLATEVGTNRDADTFTRVFGRIQALAQEMRSVRCCGSCALNLCSVALGRVDAFFEIGFGGCWDVAAGALIVEEAGGAVLDPAGGPFDVMSRRVLASNATLGPKIAAILAAVGHSEAEPGPPSATSQ